EFFARGWDLFQILPGTQYRSIDFLGEPIGSFHFSDNLTDSGTHATGNAAIITRRDDAVIDIETEGLDRAVALQLASVRDDVDLGFGRGRYFLTIVPGDVNEDQGRRIATLDGKFDLQLDFNLQLHKGAL